MCKQMAKTIGENFKRNREKIGFRSKKGAQVEQKKTNFKSVFSLKCTLINFKTCPKHIVKDGVRS